MVTMLYTDSELSQTCDVLSYLHATRIYVRNHMSQMWRASFHSSRARVGKNIFCDSSTLIDIAISKGCDPIEYFRTMLRDIQLIPSSGLPPARGQSNRSPLPPTVLDVVPT